MALGSKLDILQVGTRRQVGSLRHLNPLEVVMNVDIIREQPVNPPVTDVIIYLEPEEAKLLKRFLGRQSRNSVKAVLDGYFSEQEILDTDALIGDLFDSLYEVK